MNNLSLRPGGKKVKTKYRGGVASSCGPSRPKDTVPTRTLTGKILKLLESSWSLASPQSIERRHAMQENDRLPRPCLHCSIELYQAPEHTATESKTVERFGTAIIQENIFYLWIRSWKYHRQPVTPRSKSYSRIDNIDVLE